MESKIDVIETFTLGKTKDSSKNEDGFLITDSYIAVVDGATSKTGKTFYGETGGKLAMEKILDVIEDASGEESKEELVSKIQNVLVDEISVQEHGPASASAVIYSIKNREIWYIGDCRIMIDGTSINTSKLVDKIISDARSLAVEGLLLQGKSEKELMEKDEAREMILPFLRLQHEFENRPGEYGYVVFNNSCTELEYMPKNIGCISVQPGSMVVLATDGYPKLYGTRRESEIELHRLLKADPLCYKENKGTKGLSIGNLSYDDRTYVRFTS